MKARALKTKNIGWMCASTREIDKSNLNYELYSLRGSTIAPYQYTSKSFFTTFYMSDSKMNYIFPLTLSK